MQDMLDYTLIEAASEFLAPHVRRTPVERSPALSTALGRDVWLKLENWQLTGSFKVRGALFAMSRLQLGGATSVATCSAGNHGRGVAYAARRLGMKAVVFVPSSVDESKVTGMVRDGAQVVKSPFPGYDKTEVWARTECAKRELPFLSAFDDDRIMAANGGSLALEVLDQVPGARHFVVPVGGGGLSAGFSFVTKHRLPESRFTAVQFDGSPALQLSLDRGEAVTELEGPETLASGLEGGIGRSTFEVLKSRVDHVALVSEADLRDAFRWMMAEHQMVVEGSAAVAIAACLAGNIAPESAGEGAADAALAAAPLVVVVTGRNVSQDKIRSVLSGA